jgi:uncharacterized protein (TIGR03083 family)
MTDAPRLNGLIETWRSAVADFVALARDIPADQWDLPTDLDGWSVKDNVAHTAHLESVLAGAPEETIEVGEASHIKDLTGYYTEQGVLARRGKDMAALADEIEAAVAVRNAEFDSAPPTDGSAPPPRTPGGAPWSTQTLLSNRPLDIWMHEQDIRRAIDRPGGFESLAARHVIPTFGKALPMVVGKRVSPPAGTTVRLDVPGHSWTVAVDEDGRATVIDPVAQPTVRIELGNEDFVVLAGGRRPVTATGPAYEGDAELGRRVLENFGVTP